MVGEHDYTDANDGQESITPSSWTSHPDYNSGTTDYDFAIIKLSSELSFSNKVMPACLPDSSTNYDAVSAVVSGWGTTSSGGTQPNVLHEAEVTTRLVSEMNRYYYLPIKTFLELIQSAQLILSIQQVILHLK